MVIMPNLYQNGEGSNNNGVKPEHRKTRRGFGPPSPERKKVPAAAAGDGPSESPSSLTSQLRSLRKRSAASSDDPTSTPEKKSAGPAATAVTHSRTNSTVKQSSDDLSTSTSRHTSPEKRPPVKLTVKFKDVNRFGH